MTWPTITLALTLTALLAACTKGPSFFKQTGHEVAPTKPAEPAPAPVVLATTEQNGVVKASVQPSAELTQVMRASDQSAIVGSSVSFPPGSLAVATEVTLSVGENLASDAILKPLALGTEVASSGPSMEIRSSVEMDAAAPFVIALSLPPEAAGLKLTDGLANLLVLYKVKIQATGEKITGLIPRSEIQIKDGFAIVSTRYFGSFQAILTKTLVAEAKQVPTPVVAALAAHTYYARGVTTTTFGDGGGQRSMGFQAWALPVAPSIVGDATTLQSGVVVTTRTGD